MCRPSWVGAVVLLFVTTDIDRAADPGTALSLAERVECQRRIEEVYWKHRTWPADNAKPKPALSEVLDETTLTARASSPLLMSAALEAWWGEPVTRAALDAEILRMARDTRDPQTLRELFHALGDSPRLVAECLARPLLAERLLRGHHAYDARRHDALRARAAAELGVAADAAGMRASSGTYREVLLTTATNDDGERPGIISVSDQELAARRESLRGWFGARTDADVPLDRASALQEKADAFFSAVLLERSEQRLRLGYASWSKETFDAWWSSVRDSLSLDDALRAANDLSPAAPLPAIDAVACPQSDLWVAAASPDPRYEHVAVWTGSEMIVWSGQGLSFRYDTGGRYNPATDSWVVTSRVNAPAARYGATAVWTGIEMIVWGGVGNQDALLDSGGRYNPGADTWTATSRSAGTPTPRTRHAAVWGGSRMIVWGGSKLYSGDVLGNGSRYDPSTDTWSPVTATGAPLPRGDHSVIWTGTEMIVWGGSGAAACYNDGGRYNPASDTWTPTSVGANVPTRRSGHTAVWTGSEMLIWGGTQDYTLLGNGGRYAPSTNSWQTIATTGAPAARQLHTAVWSGAQMIVWGGAMNALWPYTSTATGGKYNPTTNAWTPTSTGTGTPVSRDTHTAVWTGTQMIVWGGEQKYTVLGNGGRYTPGSDSWTPTAVEIEPTQRTHHCAIWTGAEMIVWGGSDFGYWPATFFNTGGRYVPATDAWTATSTAAGVPEPRAWHSAVWTGSDMIVWGGAVDTTFKVFNTGAKYHVATDTWSPTSIGANVPAPRRYHGAVWTGSSMIVWGGIAGPANLPFNSGGRYDPTNDAWVPTAASPGAPPYGYGVSAVWTGNEMLVWGLGPSRDEGARYQPVSDTWTPMRRDGSQPIGRNMHTAVWTGTTLIVWGGGDMYPGGRYIPASDTWTPTSPWKAPSTRTDHTVVWTGNEMIVWGGWHNYSPVADGSAYDPLSDTWRATTQTDRPSPRQNPTAVWTGSQMLIWGGSTGSVSNSTRSLGRYCGCPHWYEDHDGDGYGDPAANPIDGCTSPAGGYVVNNGDCDDTNPVLTTRPSEARGVLFGSDRSTITWQPPHKFGGPAVTYDALRSTVVDDFTTPAICLVTSTPGMTASDTDKPAPWHPFYYLVRAVNACPVNGTGPLDVLPDGSEASGRSCP